MIRDINDQPWRADLHGPLFDAARRLDAASYEATRYARERDFAVSFEDAVRAGESPVIDTTAAAIPTSI